MQNQKRKARNIFVRELDSDVLRRRINGLTKADGGVNFYFELKNLDDEFLEFAIDLTDKLLEKGISDFNYKFVTLDEESELDHIKVTTRILSDNELENLVYVESMIPDTAKVCISEKYKGVFHDFSLVDAIQVNDLINAETAYIKSLNLSPFEEYLMAYDFMSSFCYNDDENDTENGTEYVSRLLTSSLTNGYFVCSAYAKVFCGVLNNLGIDCAPEYLYINSGSETFRQDDLHVNVLVNLHDEKYGINGIVFSDACNDARALDYVVTKSGAIINSATGETGYLLSAVNIDDVKKMRSIFSFDRFSSLKFLYEDYSKLLGNDYKLIFDSFEDEDFLNYFEFLTRKFPEYEKLKEKANYVPDEECDKICDSVKKMLNEVFGEVEVASSVEKFDSTRETETIVVYNSELSKLYKQAVILKIAGVSDKQVLDYICQQKDEVLSMTNSFDKEYEVDRVFRHNQYIASRYGKTVEYVRPVLLDEFLDNYTMFGDDFYSYYMMFCFCQRKEIAELFEKVKKTSPEIKFEDYNKALTEILRKQGYDENKIDSYVSHRLETTARDADFWFDKDAKNCFLKYSNMMWEKFNKAKNYQQ